MTLLGVSQIMKMKFILSSLVIVIFFSFNCSTLGDTPCQDGYSIFSGEISSECLKYIALVQSEGIEKGLALKLTPDTWHNPTLRLHCGKKSRLDLTPFTELEFYFRSPAPDPGNPSIQLKTWNHSSNVIHIRNHISGGVIDGAYRRVTIPLSLLKTGEWDLGNVETIQWSVDPEGRSYFVDRIKLNRTTKPILIAQGEWAPFPESNNLLRLSFSAPYLENTARDLNNYTICSESDPDYIDPKHPTEVGLHFRVFGFTPSKIPLTRYSIFIALPKPLKNACSYTIGVKGIKDEFCNEMRSTDVDFFYDDKTIVNPNIKVNQEGYLPDSIKIGYVGGYLGDLGGCAWAVGRKGAIFKWRNNAGWEKIEAQTSKNLRAVAGVREDDVFCVGDEGQILHWNGASLSVIESPTKTDLVSVSFGPQGIGWAVGKNGVILRYTNGAWRSVASGVNVDLNGVWAGKNDTAWAVGNNGLIIRWDGKAWKKEESGASSNLNAIGAVDPEQVWAVGDNGTVVVQNYGKWKAFPSIPSTKASLRCVSVDPAGGVLIAGDQGVLWQRKDAIANELKAIDSGSNKTIFGLTRQNSRRMWAAGADGLLISYSGNSSRWELEKKMGSDDLSGLFSIPFGALRLPDPIPEVTFHDLGSQKTVLKVPLKPEVFNWHLSGEDVFSFDFSSLKSDGLYQAYVPGIGVSDPIRISDGALNKAAYATAHAFYYQRCGTALTEPYAEKDFVRPVDHEFDVKGRKIDAAFHESLPKTHLHSGEKPGEMINAQGGWHDAGDYGKYMPTAAAALWYMFTGYDIRPEKFKDGSWNIPESGNGIPDLLDEARWELDWIVRVQAEDGAVHHKQTSEKWFQGTPQQEDSQRYLYEKTTHDTALAAAVLASGARLWKKHDPALAETYLNRAEKAWAFLERHPETVPAGGFRNPPQNVTGEYNDKEDIDNRLWAAAELYRTTGSQKYKGFFESWWQKNKSHTWGWSTWQDFYRCAYWAYWNSDWPGTDPVIKKEIRRGLLQKANKTIDLTSSNPYRNGARLDVPQWIGWGAFTQSSEYSFILLQAWFMSKEKKYHDMALLNLDTQLGANPLSMCFITGLGYRSPKDPLHLPSIYDGVERPIPGLPVFGATAHLPNNQPYYVAAQQDANSYPQSKETIDPYPILRRYIDANQLVPMSEFTIVEMAACATTINILAQRPDKSGIGVDKGFYKK